MGTGWKLPSCDASKIVNALISEGFYGAFCSFAAHEASEIDNDVLAAFTYWPNALLELG